jgi:hypothetical protein
MKVWIKDNHKILNFDGGKEIDLGTVFYPLRPDVAKWQHVPSLLLEFTE